MFAILYRDILLMRKSLLLMLPILLFIGLSADCRIRRFSDDFDHIKQYKFRV